MTKFLKKVFKEVYRFDHGGCVRCHTKLDAVGAPFDGQPPKPGDVTLCMHCGEAYMFNDDLSMRNLTEDEVKKLDEEEGAAVIKISDARKMIAMSAALEAMVGSHKP